MVRFTWNFNPNPRLLLLMHMCERCLKVLKCLWIHNESRKFFISVKVVFIFAPLQN